jgi:hypothetical protein
MIAQKLGSVALAVAASLALMGCQPAVQPPVGSQKSSAAVQKKGSHHSVRRKVDDDSMRVRLLLVDTVQKDLGLTPDQIEKVRDLVKIANERSRACLAKQQDILPNHVQFKPEEFEARKREFLAWYEDFKSSGKKLVATTLAMLTPNQIERLKQIQLQTAISTALAKPEIIKALDISEEQRARIRAVCDRVDAKTSAEFPSLHGLGPKEQRQKAIEFMEKSDKAWAEAEKPILDVLTPAQRAKFEKLQGKKIVVTWPHDALEPHDAEFWHF